MTTLLLPLTIMVYWLAVKIQKRFTSTLLNPVLLTLLVLIAFLLLTQTPYQVYISQTHWLSDLLEPAVIALGVPLYQQLHSIRKALGKILITVIFSASLATVTTICIALLSKVSPEITASLAPKSVTTPVAILISDSSGGIPALTAVAVLVTGLAGAIFGHSILNILRIKSPSARGMAMGIASHALGTAEIAKTDHEAGAYSALAMVLSAIFSALLCPLFVGWLI